MSAAIQFNYQFGAETIEVNDVIIDTLLPLETDGIIFKKTVPQFPFPWGHVLAELAGVDFVFDVVFHILPPPLRGTPLVNEGGKALS